jgi:uncharacterized membrane protein YtjA (UPF0391 family)
LTGFIGPVRTPPAARRKRDFVPPDRKFPRGTIVPAPDCFPQSRRDDQSRWWKRKNEVFGMLGWVVTFLVIALIAGILGFGGIAGVSIEIAKAIFFIAIVLFLISAVVGLVRGRTRI